MTASVLFFIDVAQTRPRASPDAQMRTDDEKSSIHHHFHPGHPTSPHSPDPLYVSFLFLSTTSDNRGFKPFGRAVPPFITPSGPHSIH
jgi:hypothetical protein